MGLGLQAAYGGQAVQDELLRMAAEQRRAQLDAEQRAKDAADLALRQRQSGREDTRLAAETEKAAIDRALLKARIGEGWDDVIPGIPAPKLPVMTLPEPAGPIKPSTITATGAARVPSGPEIPTEINLLPAEVQDPALGGGPPLGVPGGLPMQGPTPLTLLPRRFVEDVPGGIGRIPIKSKSDLQREAYEAALNKVYEVSPNERVQLGTGEILADNPVAPPPKSLTGTDLTIGYQRLYSKMLRGEPLTAEEKADMAAYEHEKRLDKPPELVATVGKDGRTVWGVKKLGEEVPVPRGRVLLSERVAVSYYGRMITAMNYMDQLEGQLTDGDKFLIHNSPAGETINNMLLSSTGRRYVQALRTYTEARMRKESGAAVANSEYENDRRMIAPALGDDPGTLAQKQQIRQTTADGFAIQSGNAFEERYGVQFEPGFRPPPGQTGYEFDASDKLVPTAKTATGTTAAPPAPAPPIMKGAFDFDPNGTLIPVNTAAPSATAGGRGGGAAPSGLGPATLNEQRLINGKPAYWNGTGWVEIK